jgi:hypothetical protein
MQRLLEEIGLAAIAIPATVLGNWVGAGSLTADVARRAIIDPGKSSTFSHKSFTDNELEFCRREFRRLVSGSQ